MQYLLLKLLNLVLLLCKLEVLILLLILDVLELENLSIKKDIVYHVYVKKLKKKDGIGSNVKKNSFD